MDPSTGTRKYRPLRVCSSSEVSSRARSLDVTHLAGPQPNKKPESNSGGTPASRQRVDGPALVRRISVAILCASHPFQGGSS